jgi:prephenate dehydrogenase
MINRIAILGTGLLGTSVGLALRASGFTGEITGWNRTAGEAHAGLRMGAFTAVAEDAMEGARASEVVLLAMPIYATLDYMAQLSGALTENHLVTDVGSTKRLIAESAARLYNSPGKPAFLPGHPMAGKERGGAALAEADLFRGALWLFTDDPMARRSARGLELVQHWRVWVRATGARVLDLNPIRHDELVAWVSHLPQFVATALSALLEEEVGNAPELKDVGGRALREMTRLGASPYSMWRDIAHTNTEPIVAAIHALEQRLAHLRENLRTPGLRGEFDQANRFRRD